MMLATKLRVARNMSISPDRVAALASLLMDANYTKEQAATAEPWILRGDWTYKGANAILMLSDFYHNKMEDTMDKKELPTWQDVKATLKPLPEPYVYFGELNKGDIFDYVTVNNNGTYYPQNEWLEKINNSQALPYNQPRSKWVFFFKLEDVVLFIKKGANHE